MKLILTISLLLLQFIVYGQKTWTGNTSTDWNTGSNWSPSGVPTSATDVIIPTTPVGGRMPSTQTAADDFCRNLMIQTGATLTVRQNSGFLYISGNLDLQGTISQSGANYVMLNGNNKTISMTGTWTNTSGASALRINGTGLYSLSTDITVTHLWIESAARLDALNRNITTQYFFQEGDFLMANGTLEITGSYSTANWANVDKLNPYFTTAKFSPGAGTVFYNGLNNSQRIRSTNYNKLKIRVNSGYYTVVGDGTSSITCNSLEVFNPSVAGGTFVTNNDIVVNGNVIWGNTGSALTAELRNRIYNTSGTGTWTMGSPAHQFYIYYSDVTNPAISGFGNITFSGNVIYDSQNTQLIIPNTYNNLTLRNVGTRNLTANIFINGNLLMQSATLDVTTNNYNINLRGNWIKQGSTFVPRGGTVTFDGSTAQTISAATGTHDITFTNMTTAAIPDGTGNVTRTFTAPTGTIKMKRAVVSAYHLYNSDLTFAIITPDVTTRTLASNRGNSGGHYNHVIFDDTSLNNLPPPATITTLYGDYKPQTSFSGYGGTQVGTWQIRVTDDASPDAGTLIGVQLIGEMTVSMAATNETFNNIVINNTSSTGVALTNMNITVNGGATFTDGFVYTTENLRVDFAAGSTSTPPIAGSYVVGWVRKIGNTAFTFPLGNDGGAGNQFPAPITFTRTSGSNALTDHFTATYRRVSPQIGSASDNIYNMNNVPPYDRQSIPNTLSHVSNVEYWILDRTNGTQQGTVTLSYDNARSIGVGIPADLRVCRWNSAATIKWEDKGNSAFTGTTVTSTVGAFTGFSPITLGSVSRFNVLPIKWLAFKVEKEQQAAKLSWQVYEDEWSQSFEVEKSFDGFNFQVIALMKSQNRVSQPTNYSYVDRQIENFQSKIYYRIKHTDKYGEISYTNIQLLAAADTDEQVSICPNPVEKELFVKKQCGIAEQNIALIITDITGKTWQKYEWEATKLQKGVTLDMSQLPSGTYFLRIIAEDTIKVYKINKL